MMLITKNIQMPKRVLENNGIITVFVLTSLETTRADIPIAANSVSVRHTVNIICPHLRCHCMRV